MYGINLVQFTLSSVLWIKHHLYVVGIASILKTGSKSPLRQDNIWKVISLKLYVVVCYLGEVYPLVIH